MTAIAIRFSRKRETFLSESREVLVLVALDLKVSGSVSYDPSLLPSPDTHYLRLVYILSHPLYAGFEASGGLRWRLGKLIDGIKPYPILGIRGYSPAFAGLFNRFVITILKEILGFRVLRYEISSYSGRFKGFSIFSESKVSNL